MQVNSLRTHLNQEFLGSLHSAVESGTVGRLFGARMFSQWERECKQSREVWRRIVLRKDSVFGLEELHLIGVAALNNVNLELRIALSYVSLNCLRTFGKRARRFDSHGATHLPKPWSSGQDFGLLGTPGSCRLAYTCNRSSRAVCLVLLPVALFLRTFVEHASI
jgi:hypothetical protein